MADDLRELHFRYFGFRRFLCGICAGLANTLKNIGIIGCPTWIRTCRIGCFIVTRHFHIVIFHYPLLHHNAIVKSTHIWDLWVMRGKISCAKSVQPEVCARVVQTPKSALKLCKLCAKFCGGIHAMRLTHNLQQTLRVNRVNRRKIGFVESQQQGGFVNFQQVLGRAS